MPKKRLPAIGDRAVWEKLTRGRAGIRWGSLVDNVRKDTGGNHDETTVCPQRSFGGRRQKY